MVKRKTDRGTKRKTCVETVNKIKRKKKNIKNNNNKNSNITDYILSENTFSNAMNDFNEKELIKSNFSIEKNENGIIVYTKIDIYKNGKKITKKVSMKDDKIVKNSTEIVDDNNNSEINNDIDINNNSSNNISDNRPSSNDDEENNNNNTINMEDIERKINENVNKINTLENKLNNYEERFNNFNETTMNSINFIKRNYIRKRRNIFRFGPSARNRYIPRDRRSPRYRDRSRDRDRNNRDRVRRSMSRSNSDAGSDEVGNNNSVDDNVNDESILEENNFNADNIPDIKLEDVNELNDDDNVCLICLEDYKNNDMIKKLNCNHIFHSECLKKWLSVKAVCPTCRNDLRQNN